MFYLQTLLMKIQALLWTLNSKELFTLEKLLCSCEDPNIDFSDANCYDKYVDESGKQDVRAVIPNKDRNSCSYTGDDVDYESISSNGNGTDDGTVSLPSSINCKNNPSQPANEAAFTLKKTDSISIRNETSPSGYLNVNRVSLNCITTNDAPIVVSHSLPDGDDDETLNLVTKTLSSLLNTDNTNESTDDGTNMNGDNTKNEIEAENKCDYYKSECDCFDNICRCYNGKEEEEEEAENGNIHFETGILENQNCAPGRDCLNEPESLISPDSGLGNCEAENTLSDRSPDDKVNSPSTSKETTSPSSECYTCGKIRNGCNCELPKDSSNSSPFMNCELKESCLLDNCEKTLTDDMVEEQNEEWFGIATGDGDVKTSDVNFYYQNEESNQESSQCDLRQNYWDNWETLINNQGI